MITRNIKVEINPNISELASEFCDMNADQQALFFNYIADLTEHWDKPFDFQLQEIIVSKYLRDKGKRIMRLIGEYTEQTNK